MAAARKPPWKKPKPKSAKRRVRLTAAQIAAARRRAKEAGRRYPNLVDNMWAARYARGGKAAPRKTTRARKKTARKKAPAKRASSR